MNNLGRKLKEIREEKGFPQKQLAEHLGLHRSNYSKIENNIQKLTPEQIALFCEFCDVSADYLLGINVNNKVVYNNQTIDQVQVKIKEISEMLKK